MKNYFPPWLRKIYTWYLWPHFNSVETPYKRPMSFWKKKEKEKCFTCLETRARSEGYMVKIFKTQCPKPWLVGSHTSMLVTRVNRWSLAYCRCLGIKNSFSKVRGEIRGVSGWKILKAWCPKPWLVGSHRWIPRYMDTLENNTFSIALLQWKRLWNKRVRS